MKKVFFLLTACGVLTVFLSACSSGPALELNAQTYSNSHYLFSIGFPENYSYCLNYYCINEIPEEAITQFLLRDSVGSKVLSMEMYVNLTEMSAVDYAKRSLELNSQNSKNLKEAYSAEEIISFAGEEAYSFLASDGFEERGGSMGMDELGYIALVPNKSTEVSPAFSFNFPGQEYRVVYTGYDQFIYRILYLESEQTESIIETFEFIK